MRPSRPRGNGAVVHVEIIKIIPRCFPNPEGMAGHTILWPAPTYLLSYLLVEMEKVVWHLLVRKAYADVNADFWKWLSVNTDDVLIGEHPASDDDEDGEYGIHCHVMIVNLKVTDKALDSCRKRYGLQGENSRLLKVTVKTRQKYDEDKLGIYIIKGDETQAKAYSYPIERIKAWAEGWVVHPKNSSSGETKPKSDGTHWDVILDVWKTLQDTPDIWEEYLDFNQKGITRTLNDTGKDVAYNLMVDALNAKKIRTSRNELERFYVTLVRQDPRLRRQLGQSIIRSVFRNGF